MKSLRMFIRSWYPLERLCALTDGVYAIVITLLVLDLKAPELAGLTDRALRADMLEQIPNFVAYLVSFFVVVFFWYNHHLLFGAMKRCHGVVMVLNFGHLLMVSLVPYTASLIGRYEGDQSATIVFSANLGLASLFLILLHRSATRAVHYGGEHAEGRWISLPWPMAYLGPILAVLSILVSFVSIDLALVMWVLLPARNVLFLIWPDATPRDPQKA